MTIAGIANEPLPFNIVRYAFGMGDYAWTTEQMDAYRAALATWAAVADISFVEVAPTEEYDSIVYSITQETMATVVPPEHAGIAFTGYQYLPVDGLPSSGYYVFGQESLQHLDPGDRGFWVMVHEIGHLLGLDHPHDEIVGEGIDLSIDTHTMTIMSYNHGLGSDIEGQHWFGPSYLDIQQVQEFYGAVAHNSDDSVYTLANDYSQTLYDTGGYDQLRYSGVEDVVIDLRDGGNISKIKLASGSIAQLNIAEGSLIEKGVGSQGDDILVGNEAVNYLQGWGGSDRYVFHSVEAGDTIGLFQAGVDRLDLRWLDVDTWKFSNQQVHIDVTNDGVWDYHIQIASGTVGLGDVII